MTLQIRRGTNSQRTGITPAEGELLYTTDTNLLYVGGKTGGTGSLVAGGISLAPVQTVNGQIGNVALTTDNVNEGTYNTYFTTNRTKDAAAALLTTATTKGITISYNSVTRTLTLNVIPTGIAGSLAYWPAAGNTIAASQNLVWGEVDNILTNTDGTFRIVASSSGRSVLLSDTYNNDSLGNSISIRRGRGTSIVPTSLSYFDDIGYLAFSGHTGNQFQLVANIRAEVIDNNVSVVAGRATTVRPVVNPRIAITAAFASGGTATLTFAAQPSVCFVTGQTILVAGVTPTAFNGTFVITGTPTTTQVQYALVGTLGPQTVAGYIEGNMPGSLTMNVQDINGNINSVLRATGVGRVTIGPFFTNDGGSGSLDVTATAGGNSSILRVSNYFSDNNPAILSLRKYRGTIATPTTLIFGDMTGQIAFRSYDGTNLQYTAKIESSVDGTVAAGKTPGSLTFYVTNSLGVLTLATKIGNDSTLSHTGNVVISGNLTVQGTSTNINSTTVTVDDKNIELGSVASQTVSATGTVGSIKGALLQGSTTFTASGTSVSAAGTYSGVSQLSTSGTGIGATFNITKTGSGTSYAGFTTITVATPGSGYAIGDTILISGAVLGGLLGSNSLTLTVATALGSPWAATITGMTTTTDLIVGSAISATNGAPGSLGGSGAYIVASIIDGTSLTYTATGGTTPVAGSVTNITTTGATDVTANGGGITLKGTTDKTIVWDNANTNWTASEHWNIASGKKYKINNVDVLTATSVLNDASQTSVTIAGSATTALNIGASGAPITGFAATATTSSTASSLGYLGLPQSATNTSATLAIGDSGKHIYVNTASQTMTIPANGTVAYPIGTTLTFIAGPSATTVSIAITTDTMYLAGTGTTGTRTLAAHGMATAVKVAATTWYINGTGLT